jgi:hypothetical protein
MKLNTSKKGLERKIVVFLFFPFHFFGKERGGVVKSFHPIKFK